MAEMSGLLTFANQFQS